MPRTVYSQPHQPAFTQFHAMEEQQKQAPEQISQ